jgi:PAS domain S-box-containing protein
MNYVATFALIVGVLIIWWMVDQARAKQVGGEANERPVLFLANASLPPMSFMENGKPAGIVIDLAMALAERMHHRVEIRLMNWTEAQQLVLEDRADALLQINPNPERLEIYDFSDPLLNTEFTIFTSAKRPAVASVRDLSGLKVGVEERGLPILLLHEYPQIIVEIIPDFVQGFKMLSTSALDAVVADRWVGRYVLAENDLQGVKLFDVPIRRSNSSIAVKKGNTSLLGDINTALANIRRDGTYDRIVNSWRSKEVVFKTREQLHQQAWLIAVITVALIMALVSVVALLREIRRRKRVEIELRRSKQETEKRAGELEAIMDAVPAMILISRDPQCLSVTGSRATYEFLRLPLGTNVSVMATQGESPIRFRAAKGGSTVPSNDLPVQRAAKGEEVRNYELELVSEDGETRFIFGNATPLYDDSGQPYGAVGAFVDVTERKRVEAELQRLASVVRHSSEIVNLATLDGRMIFLNEAGTRTLGIEPEAVEQIDIMRVVPDHLRTKVQEEVLPTLKKYGTWDGELQYLNLKTGKLTDVHAMTFTIKGQQTGEPPFLANVSLDITERKWMEEELRKSRDELEVRVQERTEELLKANEALLEQANLLDLAHDAILVRDLHDRVVYWNRGAEKTYGWTQDEARGQVTHDLLQTRFPQSPAEIKARLFAEGTWEGELHHTTRDGSPIIVTSRQAVQRNLDHDPTGVLEINRDITESKTIEKHLSRADRLSSLGVLAGGMAHEIRNPLQGINLFIDVLNDEDKFSRTSQELNIFEEMKTNIKKINGIISRVLNLSRQSETTHLIKLDVSHLVEDSFKLWHSRMVKDGIQSKLFVEEHLSEVYGDPIEIEQVLINLVQNAIEAIGGNGTVSIDVQNGTLSLDKKRPAVIIKVRDSGPGIPLDQQQNIFNPFFTTKYTGTGLGLAISHRIVSSHGGLLTFESVLGAGTTFTVEIPAARGN